MLDKTFSCCTTFNFTCKAPTSFTFCHRIFVISILQFFLVAFLCIIFVMFLSCFCKFVCPSLLHSHKTFHCCWIIFVPFKFLILSSSILQVILPSNNFLIVFSTYLLIAFLFFLLSPRFFSFVGFMYDLLFHSHKAFQCVLHLNFGYASLFKHAFIKVLFLYKFCLHFSHVIIEAIFF